MVQLNKNSILIGIAVLAVIVTGVLVVLNVTSSNPFSFIKLNFGMSKDAIAKKSIAYLNKSVLQQGQTATLVSSSEESGVIKISLKIGTNKYDSYATRDGKLFFPEALMLDKVQSK